METICCQFHTHRVSFCLFRLRRESETKRQNEEQKEIENILNEGRLDFQRILDEETHIEKADPSDPNAFASQNEIITQAKQLLEDKLDNVRRSIAVKAYYYKEDNLHYPTFDAQLEEIVTIEGKLGLDPQPQVECGQDTKDSIKLLLSDDTEDCVDFEDSDDSEASDWDSSEFDWEDLDPNDGDALATPERRSPHSSCEDFFFVDMGSDNEKSQ